MVLKALATRQCRIVILGEMECKWGESYSCSSLLPGQSFQASIQEGEPRWSAVVPQSRGDKVRVLEGQVVCQRPENQKGKSCIKWGLQRSALPPTPPAKYTAEFRTLHVWGNNPRLMKEQPERIRKKNPWNTEAQERCLFLLVRLKDLMIHRTS